MSTQFSDLTDKQLDDAFAAAINSHDPNAQPLVVELTNEIAARLASPYTALTSFFGAGERFPQYDALSKFNPTDAIRSSVSTQAGKVGDAVSSTLWGVLKAGAPLWIAGGVVLTIVLVIKFKK